MSRTAHAIAGARVATNRQACHLMCAAEARVHPAGSFRPRATNPPIRRALIGSAFIVGFTLLLYGAPVPRLSEELYLPLVRHTGNAAYLAGDWTLRGPFTEHWVFDHTLGWLASALPLPAFGWLGRLASWSVLAWLLIKLGTRLGASVTASTAGIALWLFANQAFIGGDWMLGTFEAKTVGYCLLVGALVAAVDGRVSLALVLLGATVSFHPGVGVWAAIGLGVTLIAFRETRAQALRWSLVGAAIAAPGIIGALSAVDFNSARLVRFVVLEAVPQHADPFFGGARLAGLQVFVHFVALLAMFVANWWWARRAPASFAHRVLFGLQLVTMMVFVVGLVARVAHWWSFLLLAPFRVGPLFVLLVFFLNLARRVNELHALDRSRAWWIRPSWRLAVLGIAFATVVTSPLVAGPRMISRTFAAWTTPDHEADAFTWIRDHTPVSTRCLVPIDRQDAFMRVERPIVVNWQAIRYDDIKEWHRRVVQLVGGTRYFTDAHATGRIDGRRGGDLQSLRRAYNALSQRQIVAIARRYQASCVVATTAYRLPVVHRAGDVRVYRLGPA